MQQVTHSLSSIISFTKQENYLKLNKFFDYTIQHNMITYIFRARFTFVVPVEKIAMPLPTPVVNKKSLLCQCRVWS